MLALRRLSFDCVNSPRAFASVGAFSVLVVLLVLFALRGGGIVSSGVLLGRLVCRLVPGRRAFASRLLVSWCLVLFFS